MRTNTLNPLTSILPTVLLTAAKIILPLLILLYGVFNFSAHYWIIVGLLIVAVMAISDRLSGLNVAHKKTSKNTSKVINSDGGSFSHTDESRPVSNVTPVVLDGGINKVKNHK